MKHFRVALLFMFCGIWQIHSRYINDNVVPFFLDFASCNSRTCLHNVESLLLSLNKSVKPCDDFYEFTCGNWITRNKKFGLWNHWEEALKNVLDQIHGILVQIPIQHELESLNTARKMYGACLKYESSEVENIQELIKLLDKFNGWPIINKTKSSNEHIFTKVARVSSELNIHPLVKYKVLPNLYNTSEYILYLNSPSNIFTYELLANPKSYSNQLLSYVLHITQIVQEIANISNIHILSEDIQQDALHIVEFELQLSSVIATALKEPPTLKEYQKISINQLQFWTDMFASENNKIVWLDIINMLCVPNNNTIINHIIVQNLSTFLKIQQLLDRTSKKIVANYVGWIIVKSFLEDTTDTIQKEAFEIEKILNSAADLEPLTRQQHCLLKINKQMSLIIGYEYAKKHSSTRTKKDVESIIENMKIVLITKIKSLIWLDEATKKSALEKARAITYRIAYSHNDSYINEFYKHFEPIGDNVIKNNILWHGFIRHKEFAKLLKPVQNDDEMQVSTTDVNAYYNILQNSIILPTGFLQYPFYYPTELKHFNYGAIGTIIGHEISHAFDNIGRQTDKDGNVGQWWSDESTIIYDNHLKCFEKHYKDIQLDTLRSFLGNFKNTKLNWVNTQNENIADIIGLELAYEAFNIINKEETNVSIRGLEEFTTEQLFFISFANQWCEVISPNEFLAQLSEEEHIPNRIRVRGALSNSERFSKAFGCSVDSPMNSKQKCNLW